MQEQFMGELKPFYGKWNWPLKDMQPGEFFTVDHSRRDPEAVRSYVSMQGARLGKYFSINAHDPERPGFCRVTCTQPPSLREEPQAIVLDYEKARIKVNEWYGLNLDSAVPWHLLPKEHREQAFIEAKQLKAPPVRRMIVTTEVPDGWFGLVFKADGFEFHPLDPNTSLEAWQEMQLPAMME